MLKHVVCNIILKRGVYLSRDWSFTLFCNHGDFWLSWTEVPSGGFSLSKTFTCRSEAQSRPLLFTSGTGEDLREGGSDTGARGLSRTVLERERSRPSPSPGSGGEQCN